MISNHYHLLAFIPAVESWEMPPALERMARALVLSGKLRINADTQRNFVRHGTSDSDATFTTRELMDPALLPATQRMLARHVPPAAGPHAVDELLERLRVELKKARGIPAAKEMQVARVLVQSAHPSVIQLALESNTEIFVSYAHNVGDLMPVHQWQIHGNAGGMQSTSDTGTQVFVSCSGDPFFEGDHKTYTTDGFPALARMVVIAGQELGHFADLLRTPTGIIGRYSTDNRSRVLRPSPAAREARMHDIQRVSQLLQQTAQIRLSTLQRAENAVAFYDKRMRFSPPWMIHQLRRAIWRLLLRLRSAPLGLNLRFRTYPAMRHATAFTTFLDDMAFNLAPNAEAYRHPDPLAEEAIACIEALARVPQQVHKWGHRNVALAWPQLYALYYHSVIPGCIAATKQPTPNLQTPLPQRLNAYVRRLLRRKPGYYP